jgi:hypothetical protein
VDSKIEGADMKTLKALKRELLADPETRAEYEAIANEFTSVSAV